MTNAYKLFNLRKDGTIGPLFIGRKKRVPIGKWVKAEAIRTPGFAFRPGWHACHKPEVPHLSKKNRVWAKVSLKGVQKHRRPESQGGLWFTAKAMRVEKLIDDFRGVCKVL